MSVDKPRDWIKYPWSFMSTRYGQAAEEQMIRDHEASGEFQLEQPKSDIRYVPETTYGVTPGDEPIRPLRANPGLGEPYGAILAPRILRCPVCMSTDLRVDSPSGAFPEHIRCITCGEDWDL